MDTQSSGKYIITIQKKLELQCMDDRSADVMVDSLSTRDTEEQIRSAYVRLARTLQSLDLEDEAQLADDVIEALRAIDSALDLAEEHGY